MRLARSKRCDLPPRSVPLNQTREKGNELSSRAEQSRILSKPMTKKRKHYYVVLKGRKPGIYSSWEECRNQVDGFPCNSFKGFDYIAEAEEYFKRFKIIDGLGIGDGLICKEYDGASGSDNHGCEGHVHHMNPVGWSEDRDCKAKGFKFNAMFEDASQSPHVKIQEPNNDILPLGMYDNDISEHVERFMRFSSLYELGNLVGDKIEIQGEHIEENRRSFLFDRRNLTMKGQLYTEDYFEYDVATDLLHFQSEDHLFAFLGLRTCLNKNEAVGGRYFHNMYKLVFVGSTKGDPGKAGVGILLKTPDNLMVSKLAMGLGIISRKLTHLHAFIIGLELSLRRGIHHLHVIGNFDAISVSAAYDKEFDGFVGVADDLMRRFKCLLVSHVDKVHENDMTQWVDAAVDLPEGCKLVKSINGSF